MHVRKLLLFGLILALLAPFALAQTAPNTEICPYSAAICIPNHFKVDCDCEKGLAFPAVAEEAKTKGTYYTNTCLLSVTANKAVKMHFVMTKLTDPATGNTLPTDLSFRLKQDGGAWTPAPPAWSTWWAPFNCKELNFAHANHKGYVGLLFRVSVVRSGLADHFGTYSCNLTITVSGC